MFDFEFSIRDRVHAINSMRAIRDLVNDFLRVKGSVVVIVMEVSKSRTQEQHYHAQIGEIARLVTFDADGDEQEHCRRDFSGSGRRYGPETWKMMLVDEFDQERTAMGEPLRRPGRYVPALDGSGRLICERAKTSDFTPEEATAFIEYLYAKGVEYGIDWSQSEKAIARAGWFERDKGLRVA